MLARKINRAKWSPKAYLPQDAIRADAVTGCLRTRDDRLSMWQCEDDPDDLDQVFLALATGPLNTGFDTMDIVVIAENELENAGVTRETTLGETAVPALRSRHVDLVALDLEKLAALAKLLALCVRSSHVKRRTQGEIKKLVTDAHNKGHIQSEELKEELRRQLTPDA